MAKQLTMMFALAVATACMISFLRRPALAPMPAPTASTCGRRYGTRYLLCPAQLTAFKEGGLAIADGVLSPAEVAEIETVYDRYMAEGSAQLQGKDFCDMSKPFDTPRANYSVINAMLPRRYYPELQGNVYEQIAQSIADQLFPDTEMVIDYDQLLDKAPGASNAVFAWHQDMAYWPQPTMTPDTRTVTFSLALDSTTKENGCIRYVPGSGTSKSLRPHVPIGSTRDESHAISAVVEDDEMVAFAQIKRGSLSMHDEYVVHGSGGNLSPGSRRTYVLAFRPADTVARERAAGFTHSHNDKVNWDVFNQWDSK
jgi:phytanoyl-CoA hydroxylase